MISLLHAIESMWSPLVWHITAETGHVTWNSDQTLKANFQNPPPPPLCCPKLPPPHLPCGAPSRVILIYHNVKGPDP